MEIRLPASRFLAEPRLAAEPLRWADLVGVRRLDKSCLPARNCEPAKLTQKMGLSNVRSPLHAEVVKLVDTLASGASARKGVEVQVLSSAPFPFSDRLFRPLVPTACFDNLACRSFASGLRASSTLLQ